VIALQAHLQLQQQLLPYQQVQIPFCALYDLLAATQPNQQQLRKLRLHQLLVTAAAATLTLLLLLLLCRLQQMLLTRR
jgi:hypothetical protein